jgi:hypothetical protein
MLRDAVRPELRLNADKAVELVWFPGNLKNFGFGSADRGRSALLINVAAILRDGHFVASSG